MDQVRCHPILRQIINRDCHVSLTGLSVVRHCVSRLKEGHKTFKSMPRADRRRMVWECLYIHLTNKREYLEVMQHRTIDVSLPPVTKS